MPREWPPLSVWLAALLLVGSPAAAFARALASGGGLLGQTGLAGMVCGLVLAVGLLRKSEFAVDAGRVYAGVVGLPACVLAIVLFAVDPTGWARLTPFPIVVAWSVGVFGVLDWPETRRWCGLLPDEPEADE